MRNKLPRIRFIAGFVIGSLLCGTAAYSVNVNNTPEGGYLLCYNSKTKAVTYPGKLSCPAGSKALELGAQGRAGADGQDGQNGLTGPAGPRGATGASGSGGVDPISYWKTIPIRDVVVDGNITEFDDAKTFIAASLSSDNLPSGSYRISASLEGLWSDTVFDLENKPMLFCYFQDESDFESDGSRSYGSAYASYVEWTGFTLSVEGDFQTFNEEPLYLVCKLSGTIKDFRGMIYATPVSEFNEMSGSISDLSTSPSY